MSPYDIQKDHVEGFCISEGKRHLYRRCLLLTATYHLMSLNIMDNSFYSQPQTFVSQAESTQRLTWHSHDFELILK